MESGHKRPEKISLAEALRETNRLVVLGDPVAGKTTMLQFLTLSLAQVKKARGWVRSDLGLDGFPLPIFVYLNRFHDIASWPTARSLLDAVREEWKAIDVLRDLPDDFFEDKIKRG